MRDYQGFFSIQDNSSETYKILFSIFVVNWFLGTMLKAQINDGLRGPTRKQRQTSDKPRRVGDRRLNTNKNFWQSPTITNLNENSV